MMLRHILTRYSCLPKRNIGVRFSGTQEPSVDLNKYHAASDEILEDLSEKLESVLESKYDEGADVTLASGVLTVVIDQKNTYVLNKQTPNRQIWLSSPISGPARFNFVSGRWLEKNSEVDIRDFLSKELSQLLNKKIEC